MSVSYIFRVEKNLIELFKGNLPLYKSYWIYYFFINLVISLPVFFIVKFTNFAYTLTLILVLKFIYYFVSCIGVWKSSQKYNGSKVLSFLARFAVVIELSLTILNIKNIGFLYSFTNI